MQPKEQRIFNELRSVFPDGITPENRAQIDSFRSQGKTLEVSIAQVIYSEHNVIRDCLIEKLKFPLLTPEQEKDEGVIDERFRTGTTVFFSILATSNYYSLVSLRLLIAAGEAQPEPKAKEGGFADIVLQNLDRDVATKMEISIDEVEQMKATYVAEGILLDEMLKGKFSKMSPLEFIDFCAEIEGKMLDKLSSDDPMIPVWKMALEQGRQRFHQLYEDIQRPLNL